VFFARFPPFWRKKGAMALRQHVFFIDQQVAERGQQMQPVIVLCKVAIADLAITEDLLNVPEGMLHFGMNTGFDFLGIQRLPGAGLFGNEPRAVLAVLMFIPLLNVKVTGVAEDPFLFSVQHLVGGQDVVNVGSGGIDAMNQSQRVIDTNVHLHAEVPFVAFSGLVRFWIALAGTVLSRAGSRNNGGINNAAFAQHQAVFLQVFIHPFKQRLAQTVLFREMPEVKNDGLVRQAVQLQAGKVPHGSDLVPPSLPANSLSRNGMTSSVTPLWIGWFTTPTRLITGVNPCENDKQS
jgi:hypothetical protein